MLDYILALFGWKTMSSCSWKSETNVPNSPSLGVGKILRPLCIRENMFFEPCWLLETLTTWVTWPNTLNKAIDEIYFGHEICWFGQKIDQQTEFCTIRVVSGGRIHFYVSEHQKTFILRQLVAVKTILYRLEFPKHPKSAASWPSKSPTRNNLCSMFQHARIRLGIRIQGRGRFAR